MSILSTPNNGRISLVPQPPATQSRFALQDRIPAKQCTTLHNATEGQWEETPLSRAFFSWQNIQILQNGIRAGVYAKSNRQYVIGSQDCDSLKIIMRSVFLTHAVNLPTHIAEQVEKLNNIVTAYCVEHVYSEAQGYMKYLYDASSMYVPLSTPIVERQKDKNNYLMPRWF